MNNNVVRSRKVLYTYNMNSLEKLRIQKVWVKNEKFWKKIFIETF